MVKPGPFVASILVLSEDSSLDTLRAVRALARRILEFIDPEHAGHRVDLEPQDERAQEAMWGNRWQAKTPSGRQAFVALARSIATKIMEPAGFVFFHSDADRLWKNRHTEPSENIRRFYDRIIIAVRQIIHDKLVREGRTEAEDTILSRLC